VIGDDGPFLESSSSSSSCCSSHALASLLVAVDAPDRTHTTAPDGFQAIIKDSSMGTTEDHRTTREPINKVAITRQQLLLTRPETLSMRTRRLASTRLATSCSHPMSPINLLLGLLLLTSTSSDRLFGVGNKGWSLMRTESDRLLPSNCFVNFVNVLLLVSPSFCTAVDWIGYY